MRVILFATLLSLLPAIAHAQSSITASTTTTVGVTSTTRAVSTIAIYASADAQPDPISYTNDTTFQSDILNVTNTYRAQHSASLLTWNSTLATYATGYSSQCIFNHSFPNIYGENIAAGYPNVSAAIISWGEERAKFNWWQPEYSDHNKTGHFSQLVWMNTTSIGCGRMKCDGRGNVTGWFTVCEFWPRGNVVGEFREMVGSQVSGPGLGDRSQGLIGAAGRLERGGWWMIGLTVFGCVMLLL